MPVRILAASLSAALLATSSFALQSSSVGVLAEQKISSTDGGFSGTLTANDRFGRSVSVLGDLNGDGIEDIAVSPHNDDEGGPGRGSLWILFLNADGTVQSEQRISSIEGGFGGTTDNNDLFGFSVIGLGDLNGEGTPDLATGAPQDDDGVLDAGAVWILFLNPDGTPSAGLLTGPHAFAHPGAVKFRYGTAFPSATSRSRRHVGCEKWRRGTRFRVSSSIVAARLL